MFWECFRTYTRPPISELFSAVRESNVIKSTCDYSFDPLRHHKNELIELNDKSGDLVHPMLINIDNDTAGDSHRGSTVRQVTSPFDKSVDPRVKRLKPRRLLNQKKKSSNKWLEVERCRIWQVEQLVSLYCRRVLWPFGSQPTRNSALLFWA